MKSDGILRRVDDLGRVVIPKSLRDRYNISEGDLLELFDEDDRIVVRKYSYRCVFCDRNDGLVEYKGKFVCKSCIRTLNS